MIILAGPDKVLAQLFFGLFHATGAEIEGYEGGIS